MSLNNPVHKFLVWLQLIEPEMIAWPPRPEPEQTPQPVVLTPSTPPPGAVNNERTLSDEEWLAITGQRRP